MRPPAQGKRSMHWTAFGQLLFAASFAAIGALSMDLHGFAAAYELLPKWLAAHDAALVIFAAVLLAGGLALFVPRTARAASLVLAACLLLRLLLLHVPRLAAHPLVEGMWESMSENLICLAGAWTIYSMLARDAETGARSGSIRAGQVIFALALPAIGLSHFFYLNMTAPLIPAWIPFHVALAYFTGAAWIAAAVGMLFNVLPRLAATLTAIMVSLFTLLVWVPMVVAAPANVADWSELCTSAAITGAAWAVAESYRGASWRLARSH